MSRGILIFITAIQAVVFLAHWVVFATLSFLLDPAGTANGALALLFLGLSIWFLAATLVTRNVYRPLLSYFYAAAALWMGMLSLLFWASIAFWVGWHGVRLAGMEQHAVAMGWVVYGCALAASAYGTWRSFMPVTTEYAVGVPNLPTQWHGRRAVLFSDVHFGNIRSVRTARSLVAKVMAHKPDIVFVPGDVFDGTAVPFDAIATELATLHAPLGVFFSEGNHEEFSDPEHYRGALRASGIRILQNEWVEVEGMAIAGIPYYRSLTPTLTSQSIRELELPKGKPAILLKHVPNHLDEVANAGISLVLSGHTHRGQMWPYLHLVDRIFGDAGYGLYRRGDLAGVTTSGFGTWGPPQRLGTRSEIVVITFRPSSEEPPIRRG